ncbi:kinase-like domain-containing protein, partial [Thelephora terrestris]
FYKEALTWQFLRHPNILPLRGVLKGQPHFAMVSEWMKNGNIRGFVMRARRTRIGLNSYLTGVARGLIYMHGRGFIHGDLKGVNILVDSKANAYIADFGLPSDSTTASSSGREPKIFGFVNSRRAEPSDCDALRMVMYEVLSGLVPLYRQHEDDHIRVKILRGERPKRPHLNLSLLF